MSIYISKFYNNNKNPFKKQITIGQTHWGCCKDKQNRTEKHFGFNLLNHFDFFFENPFKKLHHRFFKETVLKIFHY